MDFYAWMLQRIVDSGDPRHPLSVTLDRLTVQLFNTEDVTIRCGDEVWIGGGFSRHALRCQMRHRPDWRVKEERLGSCFLSHCPFPSIPSSGL